MKITAAAQTIVGPVGVSKATEARNPASTERMPIADAIRAMRSGVEANVRAAAAGMMSMAAISRTPTTLMATATTTAGAWR